MTLMESVTVSELNRQTAKVLERVKSGESVEISEYGRPVARITPAAPTTGVPLLDRLIAQGRAVPASNLLRHATRRMRTCPSAQL